MTFEEYRKAVLEEIGADPDTNVRYFEDFRKAVFDKLGAEYTREDLRNTERWRVKFLEAIQGGGGEPTGTITITENGLHDVRQYANADVNVEGDQALMELLAGTASGVVTLSDITSLRSVKVMFSGVTFIIDPGINDTVTELHCPNLQTWGVDYMSTGGSAGSGLQSGLTVGEGSQLEMLDFPELKTAEISISGSNQLLPLTALNAPKLTHAKLYIRYTNITTLNFPEMVKISSTGFGYSFNNNPRLLSVVMPKLEKIVPAYRFKSCPALQYADLGLIDAIYTDDFKDDTAFAALALRRTGNITTLGAVSAFTNTPISAGTGYIYVPRDLISTYEAATNWSTYAGQFRALEDYTDDGTLTGTFVMPAN